MGKPRMEHLKRYSKGESYSSRFLRPLFCSLDIEPICQSLIAQFDRDQQVKDLWKTAADMLAFLKDADPVIDELQRPIVSDMMKQIYDCTTFLRAYEGKGFLGQFHYTLRECD